MSLKLLIKYSIKPAIKLGLFLLSVATFSAAYADNKTTLYDFRFWTAPDHTRIVIDVERGIQYKLTTSKHKIDLSIWRAKLLNRTYKKIFYKDKRIRKTHIQRVKNQLHIFFRTHRDYQIKSFTLKPNAKYKHHRLVIDVVDRKTQNISKIYKRISAKRSLKKIILIDAGHGGEDPGAIGYKKSKEKHITLKIAKKLAKKINQTAGMKAVLTRTGNYYVPLSKRIRIAQAHHASVFISIHADSVKRRGARGASVYTLSAKGGSTKFAKQLERSENTADQFGGVKSWVEGDKFLNQILWDFSRKDRDIQSQKLAKTILKRMGKIGHLHKKRPQKAGFLVLKTPAIPSVLVETAFISNPNEERRLNNPREQNKIAEAIYRGILDYYR